MFSSHLSPTSHPLSHRWSSISLQRLVDEDDIPEGFVESRIRRLQRANQTNRSAPSPIPFRELLSQNVSWGRKDPHFGSPHRMRGSWEPDLQSNLLESSRIERQVGHARVLRRRPGMLFGTIQESSNPTARRKEAREIFDEYGISRPSG
jgi:hypothetical protein